MRGARATASLTAGGSGLVRHALVLLAVSLAVPAVAEAQDLRLPARVGDLGRGIELSPWLTLKPHVRQHALYSTNPLLEPHKTKDDDVFLATTVGVDLVAQGYHRELSVGYAGTFRKAIEQDEVDAAEHRTRLSASTSVDRLEARLDGDVAYLLTPTDPRFVGEVEHTPANGVLTLTWKQSPVFGFEGQAHVNAIDFRDRSLDFFDQLGWGANLGVNITPDLPVSFYTGGGWRELRYIDGDAVAPDLGLASASAGITAEVRRLSVSLRGGYERGVVLRRRAPTELDDVDAFLGTALITWEPFSETSVTTTAAHRVSFSSTSDYLRLTRLTLSIEQGLPFELAAFGLVAYEVQHPSDASQLRSISGTLGLSWSPREWLDVGGQVSYSSRRSRDGDNEVLTVAGAVTLKF